MRILPVLLLMMMCSFLTAFSQEQPQYTISGVISSRDETIPFAHIILTDSIGGQHTAITDIDGAYSMRVYSGHYNVNISYVGYNPYMADLWIDKDVELNTVLEENVAVLQDVVVSSIRLENTERALDNKISNAYTISSGISAEFLYRTPDKNIGEALRRVNGISMQDGKFLVVRGLSDRYNYSLLNGVQLPSTEPDRRAFGFDIIPTSVIDNVVVTKTASANISGEFAGGVVDVTTKRFDDDFLNVSIGASYGDLTTNRTAYKTQPIGFPTGFPSTGVYRSASVSNKTRYTDLIGSNESKRFNTIPNLNGGVGFGWSKNRLNVLSNTIFRNSYGINHTKRLDYQSPGELVYEYNETVYNQTQSINSLLDITNTGRNIYSSKTIVNYQIENTQLDRSGQNYDNIQDVQSTMSNTTQKFLFNSQLTGQIRSKYRVGIGYNLMVRNQPDYRINPSVSSLGSGDEYTVPWRDTYRFWSNMIENSINTNASAQFGHIEIGAGHIKRLRDFNARVFRYDSPELLSEITNNTDRYSADFDLTNTYVMYQVEIDKWKINGGVRNEYNTFRLKTADFSGSGVNVNRQYFDILPSVNLTYLANGQSKYRLSFSKTLSRPEFREVSNFVYYDFVRNAQILGNTDLEKTNIYNLDIKSEFSTSADNTVSFGVFGKHFINPIELVVAEGSVPSNLLLTYSNPSSARLYGCELELKHKVFSWMDLSTNVSLMKSSVNVNNTVRQLQGQSNWILNGSMNIHKNNHSFAVNYNRIGDRISAVGFQGYPDIFENSRDIVDAVYNISLNKTNIRVSVSDIFKQPIRYYQNGNTLINTNNETRYSLTINYNLL